MSNKYSVIVFDLGNVLLPFDYKVVLHKLDLVETGLGERFAEYYKNNYEIHRRFERGELTADEFAGIVVGALDNKVTAAEFIEMYSRIFTVNDELARALPILKVNYRLVLLSNTNEIHQKHGWHDKEFLKYFDKLVLSHVVGAVKPEERIYRAVEDFTHASPGEHLYIDDIPEYVEGGKKMGWDAVQFVGNEELFAEFEKRGIKWNDGKVG